MVSTEQVRARLVDSLNPINLEGEAIAIPLVQFDENEKLISLGGVLVDLLDRVHAHRDGDPIGEVAHNPGDVTLAEARWAETDPDFFYLLIKRLLFASCLKCLLHDVILFFFLVVVVPASSIFSISVLAATPPFFITIVCLHL